MSTPEEIQREIELTRAELASAIDAIVERVKPGNVARRTGDGVRSAFVSKELVSYDGTNEVVEEKVRWERVAGVAVVGVVLLIVIRRHRRD